MFLKSDKLRSIGSFIYDNNDPDKGWLRISFHEDEARSLASMRIVRGPCRVWGGVLSRASRFVERDIMMGE